MDNEKKLRREVEGLRADVARLNELLARQAPSAIAFDQHFTDRAAEAADFERRAREWGLFLQGRGPRPAPIETQAPNRLRDQAQSLADLRTIECEQFATAVKRARARALAEYEEKQK